MVSDDPVHPPEGGLLPSGRRAQALVAAARTDAGLTGVAADLQRVCRAAVTGLPVDGAVIHVVPGPEAAGVAAASDARWRQVGETAFTLGEAPCLDAARTLRPVLVADLARDLRRWPAYAGALAGHRVAAVFSLPLQVGAFTFGVLDLYAATPGGLAPPDLALALALARVAVASVMAGAESDGQSVGASPDLVSELASGLDAALGRAEVYQAQGMVMVLLDVSLGEAMVLIRARAFTLDRPLADLARDVVSGVVDPRRWGDDPL